MEIGCPLCQCSFSWFNGGGNNYNDDDDNVDDVYDGIDDYGKVYYGTKPNPL